MLYADNTFYTEEYGGAMSAADFKHYGAAAAAFVWQITSGRLLPEEAGRRAICAVADVMQRADSRAGISSETNDGYAVSYADASSAEVNAECYRAAALYLGGGGLFYRGVDGMKGAAKC